MQPEITSVSAALDAIGFGRVQVLLLLYTGLAWLADACETMLLSFLGPSVHCSWGIGAAAESYLTSVVFVGMLLGVTSLGLLADHLGRRRAFLASALLLGAAGLASALAPSFQWLLFFRSLVGFGLGGTPLAVTLFAEFCTSAGRGKSLLLMQGFWTLGDLLEAGLAWAVLPSLGWRWMVGLTALPLLLLLACYPLLPESPFWLVDRGRYAEAEAVLQRVAAANGHTQPLRLRLAPNPQPPAATLAAAAAEAQLRSSSSGRGLLSSSGSSSMRIRSPAPGASNKPGTASPDPRAPLLGGAAAQQQQQQHGQPGRSSLDGLEPVPAPPVPLQLRVPSRRGLRHAVRSVRAGLAVVYGPQLRRTTLLLYVIWFANAITYYGLVLLTTALQAASHKEECTPAGGPNLDNSDFAAIFVATLAEAPGLLLAVALIDGRGRKWTLRAGLLACAAAMGGLALAPPRGAQLALLFAARAAIEGSFSVLYVYAPELYPTSVRSLGLALCNAFSRVGGFLAPFATVALVADGHARAAAMLLGTLCAAAAFCAFLLPYETRGRDLQATELEADGDGGGGGGKEPGGGPLRPSSGSAGDDAGSGGSASLQHVRVLEEELELEPTHDQEHHQEEAALLPPPEPP